MRGPTSLSDREGRWVTDTGAWFPGERVVLHGTDLLSEFRGRRWMDLLLFSITKRRFSDEQILLFEGFWTLAASFPDPRLWNNRVAALAGTVRSTAALALAAATAVSEASVYGRRPDIRAIDFLLRTREGMNHGGHLEDLVEQELRMHRNVPGYGRPIVKTDERIGPVLKLAEELGLADGEFTRLAFQIEEQLQSRWRMRMNVAALIAALAADQDLSRKEYYAYTILSFSAGVTPCYLDTAQTTEGTFFPVRCGSVAYAGAVRRGWNAAEDDR